MIGAAELAELFALGALLGFLGGLLGIGGGLFAIPLLGALFGFDEQHAQGTALVMVVPNVALGLWNYMRKDRMEPRIGWSLALAALPFTFAGAHVATHVPSAPLRIAFAIFVICIGLFTAWRALRGPAAGERSKAIAPWPAALLVGAFGGALSGLFSVGGAVFAVPLVSLLFGLPQAVAQGFGLALVAPGTLVGIVAYALAGDVDWGVGVPLAIGGIVTVSKGVNVAHRLPERSLRLAFAGLMFVSAAVLLVKG